VPELLLVGQALILPLPQATPPTPDIQNTSSTSSLRVVSVNSYPTPMNGLWILGEVKNNGAETVQDIEVNIILMTSLGEPLLTETARVVSGVLPSGGKAPFGILIEDIPSHYDFVSSQVVSGQSMTRLGDRYLDLAVNVSEVTIRESLVRLSGSVQNAGSTAARQLMLVTTLYDNQGNVTGYHELFLPGTLAVNDSVTFEIEIVAPGGQTTDYSVTAQALKE
jgi:hypothetical protein